MTMAERMIVLPDERLIALRPALIATLQGVAREVSGEAFASFLDASMRSLLVSAFQRVDAHEGTVWLLDETKTALIPRFNSGENAEKFVGRFRQELSSGMISMVAMTEQPICENEICRNARHDGRLDGELRLKTWAMIAVPFYFFSELRGVISCVQLVREDLTETTLPGFSAEHLHELQHAVGLLSRVIEYRILAQCLGLEGLG